MQKKFKVQIEQTVGNCLKPLKTEEITFQKQSTFEQFTSKIKQKYEAFNPIKFYMYLPLMNSVEINKHNFQEYLQNLSTDPRYSKVGIQKVQFNFEPKEDLNQNKPKAEDQNYSKGFLKKPKYEEIDNLFARSIQGNPSDSTINLVPQDIFLLQHLQIITKKPPKVKQMQELKQKVKNAIVKHLTVC